MLGNMWLLKLHSRPDKPSDAQKFIAARQRQACSWRLARFRVRPRYLTLLLLTNFLVLPDSRMPHTTLETSHIPVWVGRPDIGKCQSKVLHSFNYFLLCNDSKLHLTGLTINGHLIVAGGGIAALDMATSFRQSLPFERKARSGCSVTYAPSARFSPSANESG